MNGAKWMAVAAAAGLVMATGCRTMCERPVSSVPPAALKSIDQYAEGGTIRELETKEKGGVMLYEAKVKKEDGSKLKIIVNADGKLYKLERKEQDDD